MKQLKPSHIFKVWGGHSIIITRSHRWKGSLNWRRALLHVDPPSAHEKGWRRNRRWERAPWWHTHVRGAALNPTHFSGPFSPRKESLEPLKGAGNALPIRTKTKIHPSNRFHSNLKLHVPQTPLLSSSGHLPKLPNRTVLGFAQCAHHKLWGSSWLLLSDLHSWKWNLFFLNISQT